jgi:hypothetical protein
MSNNMERPMDSDLLERRAKSKEDLERLLARIKTEHKPKPKTLEKMFGPEKAAEMRREAAKLRKQDGNID